MAMRPQIANNRTASRAPTALTLQPRRLPGWPASVHISSATCLLWTWFSAMAIYLIGGCGWLLRDDQASIATMARPVSSRTTATVCSGLSKAKE
ncbi:hypothetical protein IG631_00955 [Alternaria alternata]|nr:hypothetical protein IG631_00955 [Alternaria alternata]